MTKNKSFIELCERVKTEEGMDIRYILETENKSLEHVDPFSENLTSKQKKDIIEEIKNNKWYFFREIVRVCIPGSYTPIPYQNIGINKMMLSSYTAKEEGRSTLVSSPRQTMKSYQEIIYALWEAISLNKEFAIYKNTNFTRNIFNIYEILPKYIMKEIKFHKHFKNVPQYITKVNKEKFKIDGNEIWIFDDSLPEEFKEDHFSNVFRITAMPINKPEYFHVIKLWNSLNDYRFNEVINDKFVKITYKWWELGKSQEWYDEMKRIMPNDEFIAQELDVEWPVGIFLSWEDICTETVNIIDGKEVKTLTFHKRMNKPITISKKESEIDKPEGDH